MAAPIPITVPEVGRDALSISNAPGTIYSYSIVNRNSYTIYVKFYDKLAANVNPATDAPAQTITIAGKTTANVAAVTLVFATAISVRCVTAPLNADTTAPAATPTVQVDLADGGGGGSVTGTGLTSGNVITGAGGQAIQDSGTPLANVATGNPLSAGNVVIGNGASAIADSGIALANFALDSELPTNLNQLAINDHSILRKKVDYTSVSSIASVTSGSTATLAPGGIYYGDISSNLTFAFSPALAEADASILVYTHLTTALTLTYPTAIRNADNGSTTSVAVLGAQYAVLQFFKTGAGNIRLLDNIITGVSNVDIQVFAPADAAAGTNNTQHSYTWTKPVNGSHVWVYLIGAGAGGGGGRFDPSTTVAHVGGGGGGGGGYTRSVFAAAILGTTETVLVGVGGQGGAAKTSIANGGNGVDGGATSFGAWAKASAGGGGLGGASGAGGGSGNGGTAEVSGNNGASANTTGTAGSNPSAGGTTWQGNGGGSGGGITSANAGSNGGAGGNTGNATKTTNLVGGTAGTGSANGGNGASAAVNEGQGGAGGGGGGVLASPTSGTNGGNGGNYGGGGGGGGAGETTTSGAGGNGANGIAIVITI